MSSVFRRSNDLHVEVIDDEAVVYDPTSHVVHHLNATALCVLDACDGRRATVAVVELVARQYGVASLQVQDSVMSILDEFRERGLIDTAFTIR